MANWTWDQVLLKKFSSTGHFRLLKQLKNDLKLNPIHRGPARITRVSRAQNPKKTDSD